MTGASRDRDTYVHLGDSIEAVEQRIARGTRGTLRVSFTVRIPLGDGHVLRRITAKADREHVGHTITSQGVLIRDHRIELRGAPIRVLAVLHYIRDIDEGLIL